MRAVLLGATGAVGRDLLRQLLEDPSFTHVVSLVRRPSGVIHPRLEEQVVNFAHPEEWSPFVAGDVAFCAFGTTLRAAGSKEAQYVIDHDYPLQFARSAREAGVPSFVLVSSRGANARAGSFYLRMKGELEEHIQALHFPRMVILRPSLLVRRGTDRLSERLSLPLMQALTAIGPLSGWRPIPTERVASVMLRCAQNGIPGDQILENTALHTYPL